ncbi:MAG: serine hydrolase [Isosphaeraceae bacterium]|nr:serine hydrolase [Isosphaeraceae bacterium]
MIRPTVFAPLGLLVLSPWAHAKELPKAPPAAVGLSAEKLSAIKPTLQKLVDQEKLAGGVALVARHGKVAYLEPFGYRDLATKAPMTADTIFAIASMTKPVTCVAAMMLVEEGKLSLDDPVGKYLPELSELRVLGDRKDDLGDKVATVPARRPVSIRHLLAHASGIAYGGILSTNARLRTVYEGAGVQDRRLKTIAEQVARLATVPLAHQPGEGWTYGLSHDVLGRVAEVVSGERFDQYLQTHLFAPLDMRDTGFRVPEDKRERVATLYRAELAGGLTPLPKNYGTETFFSGGGGLFSTARDYSRFAQMLLNGGELDGVRLLKPETITTMTTNQIGKHNALFLFKYGLGFGLEMTRTPGDRTPRLNRYFWGGVFSTYFFIDPRQELVGILMTQVIPTNSSGAEREFRRVVDTAIEN